MKKLILHALAVCCLSAPGRAQTPTPPAAQKVQPAPVVKLEPAKLIDDKLFAREQREIGGRVFRLSEYRGRVFVINVWATWCPPCWQEIPGFNRIYDDYRPRGVEFIGLTNNDPTNDFDKVQSASRELKMKYRLAWLDYETATALMGTRQVIPQTFVVGTDGRILLHIRGYNQRVPEMVRSALWQALNPSAPATPSGGTAARPSDAPAAPTATATPTKPAPTAPPAAAPRP
ncbi:MAG TPA: TlpA disulfide reductase family protein [Pyrinomonadaceae bacterium]|nr:TlpA disulfide reductase family protein [Pyrinomonadaceae bacterium]